MRYKSWRHARRSHGSLGNTHERRSVGARSFRRCSPASWRRCRSSSWPTAGCRASCRAGRTSSGSTSRRSRPGRTSTAAAPTTTGRAAACAARRASTCRRCSTRPCCSTAPSGSPATCASTPSDGAPAAWELIRAMTGHQESAPAATVFSRFLRHLAYLELPGSTEPLPELHWFPARGGALMRGPAGRDLRVRRRRGSRRRSSWSTGFDDALVTGFARLGDERVGGARRAGRRGGGHAARRAGRRGRRQGGRRVDRRRAPGRAGRRPYGAARRRCTTRCSPASTRRWAGRARRSGGRAGRRWRRTTGNLLAGCRSWLRELAIAGWRGVDHDLVVGRRADVVRGAARRAAAARGSAVLLDGLAAELRACGPIATMERLPARRWADLWSRALLLSQAGRGRASPRPTPVSGPPAAARCRRARARHRGAGAGARGAGGAASGAAAGARERRRPRRSTPSSVRRCGSCSPRTRC